MALRLNLDALSDDVDPPATEGLAAMRFLRLRYQSFETSLRSAMDFDNDEEAQKSLNHGLVLMNLPRLCYFADLFWWRCIILPLIFANAVVIAMQLTFTSEPSRGTCIDSQTCVDFRVFKLTFLFTIIFDIVVRPSFGKKYDWLFLNALEFLIVIPACFGGSEDHSYLYDLTGLLLLTTFLGPRRYWTSFSAFIQFYDALRIPGWQVPGLKVVSDSVTRRAQISSMRLSTKRLRSRLDLLQNTEDLASSAALLDRRDEEGVPSNGAWLAKEEYDEPFLRGFVTHLVIGYKREADFDLWPYVPGSETDWVVTGDLLWVVAAATFIHHVLSGHVSVTEASFQEAVQLHVKAVESYARLLGLPPSSLTSLCNNAHCDQAGTFDASALLMALVQLGQDPPQNFIVTMELCPADSEEFPLTEIRVCATSLSGEAKYFSIHDSGAHFGDLKEKIRFEFGIDPKCEIEGLTADGTLLRNSDKLPEAIMNTTQVAGDDLV